MRDLGLSSGGAWALGRGPWGNLHVRAIRENLKEVIGDIGYIQSPSDAAAVGPRKLESRAHDFGSIMES